MAGHKNSNKEMPPAPPLAMGSPPYYYPGAVSSSSVPNTSPIHWYGPSDFCKSCRGKKVVPGIKTVSIDIAPGTDDEDVMKVLRSGQADPDGLRAGDLYVAIKVRGDPVFRREKGDIHVDAVLNVTQAILGGTVQVPTLAGDVVLKVKPGTQPGQKVVLRGKGIKTRNSYSYGDQYVHFNVKIPVNLTQKQRMLLEEFEKEEKGEDDKDAEKAAGASG
ncbi:chaperone protein dnaJ GFA2, mitochondrial [Triticum aestivum]|uniref:chaperone protein dnaJ GFA2, mitochondrial n=1 Tax=Triticum aestivum TaxID=4565 RepID=UPI001D02BECD|nr:chaperone protein dnaJ GFA2, mitochondrial-like [Triticum aestivum]